MRDIDSGADLETLAAFSAMALFNLGSDPLTHYISKRNVFLRAYICTRPATDA
jgi:hypothetical protein